MEYFLSFIILLLISFIIFQKKEILNIKKQNQKIISILSHEIKTPLTVLRSHWENEIYNENLPIELRQRFVNDVDEISRLTNLVNRFLGLMKFELTDIKLKLEIINLTEIVMDILDILGLVAEDKNIKLSFICKDNLSVNGDKQMLFQAIFNIIENAIKYSESDTKVEVIIENKNNLAIIKIIDKGVGIASNKLSNIFDIFNQIDSHYSGIGLGLAISNLIIKQHNGIIKVKSKINQGSEFQIKLKKV